MIVTQFLTKKKSKYTGEKTACSINGAGHTGSLTTCRRVKLKFCLSPYKKLNSKDQHKIKDLNIRPDNMSLTEA